MYNYKHKILIMIVFFGFPHLNTSRMSDNWRNESSSSSSNSNYNVIFENAPKDSIKKLINSINTFTTKEAFKLEGNSVTYGDSQYPIYKLQNIEEYLKRELSRKEKDSTCITNKHKIEHRISIVKNIVTQLNQEGRLCPLLKRPGQMSIAQNAAASGFTRPQFNHPPMPFSQNMPPITAPSPAPAFFTLGPAQSGGGQHFYHQIIHFFPPVSNVFPPQFVVTQPNEAPTPPWMAADLNQSPATFNQSTPPIDAKYSHVKIFGNAPVGSMKELINSINTNNKQEDFELTEDGLFHKGKRYDLHRVQNIEKVLMKELDSNEKQIVDMYDTPIKHRINKIKTFFNKLNEEAEEQRLAELYVFENAPAGSLKELINLVSISSKKEEFELNDTELIYKGGRYDLHKIKELCENVENIDMDNKQEIIEKHRMTINLRINKIKTILKQLTGRNRIHPELSPSSRNISRESSPSRVAPSPAELLTEKSKLVQPKEEAILEEKLQTHEAPTNLEGLLESTLTKEIAAPVSSENPALTPLSQFRFQKEHFQLQKEGGKGIQVKHYYTSYMTQDFIEPILLDAIKNAKKSITIMMSEFRSDRIAAAIYDAAGKGIEIRVITDKKSFDPEINRTVGLEEVVSIFANKIKAFHVADLSKGGLLHYKTMIVDEKDVYSGSYNHTIAANRNNSENFSIIEDQKLARFYLNAFDDIVKNTSLKKDFKLNDNLDALDKARKISRQHILMNKNKGENNRSFSETSGQTEKVKKIKTSFFAKSIDEYLITPNGKEKMESIFSEEIKKAQKSIDILIFKFTSQKLLNAIEEKLKSQEGKDHFKIKITLDYAEEKEILDLKRDTLSELDKLAAKYKNLEVKKVNIPQSINPETKELVNSGSFHNKLMIIDDNVICESSCNYTDDVSNNFESIRIIRADDRNSNRKAINEYRKEIASLIDGFKTIT